MNKKLDNYVKGQLCSASFRIGLNIVESSGKFSKPDRRNYFVTSRGPVFERVSMQDILCNQGIITKDQFETHIKKADELSKILYAMTKNLS